MGAAGQSTITDDIIALAPARPLRIATRSSELALWQARKVQSELAARGLTSELVTYTTIGDRTLDRPLNEIGSKGLFTAELEADLIAGRVDCCVHSLKDLPTADPVGLTVAARLERADARDALVLAPGVAATTVGDLPPNARVGTSSLRRRALLLGLRPDLEVVELRGNVPTRVRKVMEGQVHAAVLAAAGLLRLELGAHIAAYLDPPVWLPAAGQGAVAVQVRADDAAMVAIFGLLDHARTTRAVSAERAFLGALEGGCQVPIGAWTAWDAAGGPVVHGFIGHPSGAPVLRGEQPIGDDPAAAGRALAEALRERGAESILAGLRTGG